MLHTTKRSVMCLACALMLALACFVLPRATAEERTRSADILDVDFSVSPAEMVSPSDVTMTFILHNPTEYDVKNLYLSSADGLISEPVGQIAAGETQTLVRPHTVTQTELDDGAVRYIISYDAADPGDEKVSRMLSAYIVKGSARPEVDFTRQLSSRQVVAGGQLTVAYRLSNNGNVPVTDLQVRDQLGDFIGRLERLEIGATRTFISRVTLNADAESVATLEYRIPSGEVVTKALDPAPVRLSESTLDASFSIGLSAFDSNQADAVLILTNTGSDDYTDVTVVDDVYGGVIADAVSLPSGANPQEIAFTYPVRSAGEYRWRVTGTSQSGEALDFTTETLTLDEAPLPPEITVSLKAKARATKINRAGRVTFDLELTNTGTVTAQGLKLYELERGDVRQLAVLPTGDPLRCSVSYDVSEDQQFIFCVNYQDAGGHARTATASPVSVEITPAGVDPEPDPDATGAPKGPSVKMGNTRTFTILLVVASAALVSMFTILLVTSLRARQDRRKRLAAQRLRRTAANRTGDGAHKRNKKKR
ncbi:MAG: hypothetical protein IJJ45_01440 [Clostridia bacterium]|nr:hypothetical protein [Clostridia bacterium]